MNYKIKKIDNFLNASDFSNFQIMQEIYLLIITVYHNEIDEKNNIIDFSIDKDLLIKINKIIFKALILCKELNPEAKLFCYSDLNNKD